MTTYKTKNFEIDLNRQGADRYTKVSYPIRYGRFAEVKTADYLFQFDLNGRVKYISGLNGNWPHPAEWLKRTAGNDWIYYSTGGYRGVFAMLGEYYRPCLTYPSNAVWAYDPFADPRIEQALNALADLKSQFSFLKNNGMPAKVRSFCELISAHDIQFLKSKAKALYEIIGGRISVLPPDTRHVDYEVIPLMIADGCLYQCKFCMIKSRRNFRIRSGKAISRQIQALKSLYGADLPNYNALFLGNHDALAAGKELICQVATEAYTAFGFEKAYLKDPSLFLFASVDSFLKADQKLFEALNRRPFYTYINIGLESGDLTTLRYLNKPVDREKIGDAFDKMLVINRSFPTVEVTANFLMGDQLPPGHYESIIELIRNGLEGFYSKGAVYLSPLMSHPGGQQIHQTFVKIKKLSRLPTFLYLIQRL